MCKDTTETYFTRLRHRAMRYEKLKRGGGRFTPTFKKSLLNNDKRILNQISCSFGE